MERIAEALGGASPQDIIADQPGESVPIIGVVQAGAWSDHAHDPDETEVRHIVVPPIAGFETAPKRASRVVGPSMNLLYPDGSIVVWVPHWLRPEEMKVGRRYIVERERHGSYEVTLKEFHVDDKGREWLLPRSNDPAEQAPIPVVAGDGETIRIVGRVIWAARQEEN